MNKAIIELFKKNKILTDEEMRDFIYFVLIDTHPDEVDKLENSKGGWINYWIEVLQLMVIIYYNGCT